MIRFLPDTWRDALMRPFAMAAPDASVYVEIAAPDVRFAVIVILAVLSIFLARRNDKRITPTVLLLLWVVAAFTMWLATTGNGRYFTAVLVLAGPLCIGLVHHLRTTRMFRLTAAAGILLVQGVVLYENDPFDAWGLATWTEPPYFGITLDEQAKTVPTTYVTVTTISYSLVAPLFPASSRWLNISSLPNAHVASLDGARAQKILAESPTIHLLIPTQPSHMTAQRQPTVALREVINGMLGTQKLALREPLDCRLLVSHGLATYALRSAGAPEPEAVARYGFWACSLNYPVKVEPPKETVVDDSVRRIFEAVENRCPRFFQPGQKAAGRLSGGWVRVYPQADIKLYDLDDGQVFYKYWRALNPVLIGESAALLGGRFEMDCNVIRGRAGLPWEREI